jgi:amidase
LRPGKNVLKLSFFKKEKKMKRVSKKNVCSILSAENPPVLNVAAGESFCLETADCYNNNLKSTEDLFTEEMVATCNPATGPVYIDGTESGDILQVVIEKISIRDHAVMFVDKGTGALGDKISGAETVIYPIGENTLILKNGLKAGVEPMIGVIGTAPKSKAVPTTTPGEHGGNMDCKIITAGSKVYLPVEVQGALLCAGDIHALQGDGEVCICAAEVSGEIEMRANVVKGFLPTPCVETTDHIYFIGSALTLDQCQEIVLDMAFQYLTKGLNVKSNYAARVMSLLGELQVCQVVDPLKTMRFALPKKLLASCGMGKNLWVSI